MNHVFNLNILFVYLTKKMCIICEDNLTYDLTELDLKRCFNLTFIPDLSKFKKLQKIDCSHCYNLKYLPELKNLLCLIELDCSYTNISSILELPITLQVLNCNYCMNIKCLPKLSELTNLISIYCIFCINLETIPSVYKLKYLKELHCSRCISLKCIPKIPDSLEILGIYACKNLQEMPVKLSINYKIIFIFKKLTFISWLDFEKYSETSYKNKLVFMITENYENYRKKLCKKISEKIISELLERLCNLKRLVID